MKLIFFFIFLFVGANCLTMKLLKDTLTQSKKSTNGIKTSVDQLSVKHNKTSFTIDQLSASVAENKKYMKEEHNETSSILKVLENKLDDIKMTEKILDQKIVSISKDQKQSALNTNKLQSSVDQLSVEHNETSFMLKTLEQKLDEIQKSHYQFREENLVDDCSDLSNVGLHVSTSYFLQKYNKTVKCNMETNGGGWLLIQKRQKATNQVDFNRNWASYKEGFGDLDTEFWIGNKFLHRITNQKSYELRIDMEDFEKGHFYANYSEFRVGNEESGYQLHVGGYEGNIRDSLEWHNNMKFTTFDRDNDKDRTVNCAKKHSGGFWYKYCGLVTLNGLYPTVPDRKNEKLINWVHNGEWLNLINVEMKIRPKQ